MSVTITYFVHSITIDNQAKIATGWLPGELSPRGIERAQELAKLVADRQFAAVFSSDLHRAVQTAEIVFGDRFVIRQDWRLRECHYGQWDGGPAARVKSTSLAHIDTPFPGGESYRDVAARMASFLADLHPAYEGKQVAIIGHHATQLALEVLWNHKTWPQAFAEDWRKTQAWQPGWDYKAPIALYKIGRGR